MEDSRGQGPKLRSKVLELRPQRKGNREQVGRERVCRIGTWNECSAGWGWGGGGEVAGGNIISLPYKLPENRDREMEAVSIL